MFKATKITDKIQDTICSKYRCVDNNQMYRLIDLLLSVCESENQALDIAKQMPTQRDAPGGKRSLRYGEFRLDVKTLKWEILF